MPKIIGRALTEDLRVRVSYYLVSIMEASHFELEDESEDDEAVANCMIWTEFRAKSPSMLRIDNEWL